MLVSLLGTPWFPQVEQGILFFEDVNEHPYRVERMLLQLAQAGVLERQQAVLLGDFSNYALAPADNGYNFDEMLAYLRRTVRVPILTGLPFGHGRTRATIPVGAQGDLCSTGDGFTLTLSGYPTVAGSSDTPVHSTVSTRTDA
jgi:muramoyltetrapeptide carboxypeptidase